MTTFFDFAILGMSSGGFYILLACCVILVYQASGVVNFATGAIALAASYAFFDLRSRDLPTVPSFILSVLIGLLIGVLTHVLVMRPLRASSPVTKMIATLAVLVILQSAISLRYGNVSQSVQSFLPNNVLSIFGARVAVSSLIVLGVAIVLPLTLWVFFRSTRFGLATRAVAESEQFTAALGWSPNLIAGINWAIAGALSGICGVLLAPMGGLAPGNATDLIVPTLAVALFANLSSLPMAICGGLLLGIIESELTIYASLPVIRLVPGIAQAVPVLFIIVILTIRGRTLPGRDFVSQKLSRVGTGRISPVIALPALVIAFLCIQFALPSDWVAAVTTCMIAAVVLLSVVLVTGIAGQLSLAQFSFAGVAGLVATHIAADAGWPLPVSALVGIASALPVGFIVGLPAVRTRGVTLAVVTLGLAAALQAVLFSQSKYTGSITGVPVGPLSLFGVDVSASDYPRRYGLVVLAVLAIMSLVVANVRSSSVGRALLAIRANERAAASLGVWVAANKLYAFVVGAGIAGVGGILLSYRFQTALFAGYDPFQSVTAVEEATIGSIGFIPGSYVGSSLEPTGVGDQIMHNIGLGSWLPFVGGILLLVTLITAPNGVAANFVEMRSAVKAKLRFVKRRGPVEPVRDRDAALAASAPSAASEPTSLRVRGLSVSFGRSRVVDGVDFTVTSGEILGIIGPNGAGKTTLIDAISGYVNSTGEVYVGDRNVSSRPPHIRAHHGLVRSFQSLELFEDVTVRDNLLIAADSSGAMAWVTQIFIRRQQELSEDVAMAVAEFGLDTELDRYPSELAYARRRLLAITRAIAARPKILLLDEPAAGLGEHEREELGAILRRLATTWRMAIVLIEHDVELVMGLSDRVLALDFGKVVAYDSPQAVRTHPEVVRSYLGLIDDEDDDTDLDQRVTRDRRD